MPETRSMLWFRRAALAATLLCAIVVVVGAWVRLTNAGLGCPDWPGCYGHMHPAQAAERVAEINAANPDRPFDYQKAINEMVHRYIVGGLGTARDRPRVALGDEPPRSRAAARAALGAGRAARRAGAARHVDGDAAPEAAHRHAASARRAPDARAPVVARAAAGAPRTESGGAVRCGGSPSRASRCSRCRSRSAAGPARTTRPRPARIFRPARPLAGRLWTSGTPSSSGAASESTMRAACSTRRRASRSITRIASAPMSRHSCCCWWSPAPGGAGNRKRRGSRRSPSRVAVVLQVAIGMNLVWKGWPLSLGTAHNAGAALLVLATVALLRSLSPRSEVGRYRPSLR